MTADFDKLRVALSSASSEEGERIRIDEAKKRAMHQAVNYDNFKDIVAASHLTAVPRESVYKAASLGHRQNFRRPKKPVFRPPSGVPSSALLEAVEVTQFNSYSVDFGTALSRCESLKSRLELIDSADKHWVERYVNTLMEPAAFEALVEALFTTYSEAEEAGTCQPHPFDGNRYDSVRPRVHRELLLKLVASPLVPRTINFFTLKERMDLVEKLERIMLFYWGTSQAELWERFSKMC